ncbi:hypothetical protein AVEN_190691-1 [Araneus ventricosus]|uniref:Uncharacterized protein n=1 Tax=Araneus ventricosus TaxID=182803 RepID=A0A4Y2KPX4_ARAVE|nr:hypothetical protein AVEN_190691-1 [Araneus ventricosus]
MIVLGWITNAEPWNTFMGNRIKEIRELPNVEDWRFIPGDINPADLSSRSCDWSELLRSRWWEGPKWLYECPEFWPYKEITLPEEAMIERRKTVVGNLNIEPKESFGNRFLYFSSYPRITLFQLSKDYPHDCLDIEILPECQSEFLQVDKGTVIRRNPKGRRNSDTNNPIRMAIG